MGYVIKTIAGYIGRHHDVGMMLEQNPNDATVFQTENSARQFAEDNIPDAEYCTFEKHHGDEK